MSLTESRFHALADDLLQTMVDVIEEAVGDHAEIDLIGGVLTIELESGGQYVINKHAPNREIWLSSPSSGAWHFVYDADGAGWRSTRDPEQWLTRVLSRELEAATGTAVPL